MIKKITGLVLMLGLYLNLASTSFAQAIDPRPIGGTNLRPLTNYNLNTVGTIVRNGVTILFIVAVIASLFFLIAGGIKWITSGGDKANLEQARNWIVAAAVGLIITFSSYFILNVILNFFGLPDIWTFQIPTLS